MISVFLYVYFHILYDLAPPFELIADFFPWKRISFCLILWCFVNMFNLMTKMKRNRVWKWTNIVRIASSLNSIIFCRVVFELNYPLHTRSTTTKVYSSASFKRTNCSHSKRFVPFSSTGDKEFRFDPNKHGGEHISIPGKFPLCSVIEHSPT